MNTVLITGGAGFIGTNLCNKLINDNKIICIDNLSTSTFENIKDLNNHKNFTFINDDIINIQKINDKIDIIYNLACPASPIKYQNNPINTLMTCVIGTKNMLEIAKEHNAVFIQASTSEVYGDPIMHPQQENYWGNVNPVGIRSCYDEGKRCAETLCMDYYRLYNTKIKIIRIFNTYRSFYAKG